MPLLGGNGFLSSTTVQTKGRSFVAVVNEIMAVSNGDQDAITGVLGPHSGSYENIELVPQRPLNSQRKRRNTPNTHL